MKTPTQQALIQLAESIVLSALVAALTAVLPLVTGDGSIDWRVVGIVGGTGFLLSLAHSAAAYLRQSAPNSIAPTDQVSLADLIDALADGLAKRYATRPLQNAPTTPVAASPMTVSPNIPMSALPTLSSLVASPALPLQGGIENETTAKRPASA